MKTYLIIILSLFVFQAFSQKVPVLIDICADTSGGPNRLHSSGTDMYFSKSPMDKIMKFDATQGFPTAFDIVSEPDNLEMTDMLVVGTDLFFVTFGASFGGGKIYKKDLTNSSSIPIPLITGLSYPNGMVLRNNEVYFSQSNPGMIMKFDISATNPVLDTVVTGLYYPTGIAFNGDDLYISLAIPDKVVKINVSSTTPIPIDVVTGIDNPVGLRVKNDFLVIALYNENKVVILDLNNPSSGTVDLVLALKPTDIEFIGDELFISENEGNKISKLLNASLTISEKVTKRPVLYPNPATDFISISNLSDGVSYTVYGIDGKTLIRGRLIKSQKIDVNSLMPGVYFIKLDNRPSIRFLKR